MLQHHTQRLLHPTRDWQPGSLITGRQDVNTKNEMLRVLTLSLDPGKVNAATRCVSTMALLRRSRAHAFLGSTNFTELCAHSPTTVKYTPLGGPCAS
ncbi:hypothetical protein NMY22_g1454 [Coprinellus aureogranulatus]|nr:hypothetical protein NMY22_g1454 [Coprinellus aureogranulatus]